MTIPLPGAGGASAAAGRPAAAGRSASNGSACANANATASACGRLGCANARACAVRANGAVAGDADAGPSAVPRALSEHANTISNSTHCTHNDIARPLFMLVSPCPHRRRLRSPRTDLQNETGAACRAYRPSRLAACRAVLPNARRAAGFRFRPVGRSFGVLTSYRVGTDLRWFKAKGEPSLGKGRATRRARQRRATAAGSRAAF